ncbi:MAG TPA: SBBP repeat-containing protein [Fimbriimonadaceae bacterium]
MRFVAKFPIYRVLPLLICLGAANAFATQNGAQVFVENKGQWDLQAKFLAQSGGLNMWITEDGAVMDFHKTIPATTTTKKLIAGHVVRMSFENALPGASLGLSQQPGDFNYFVGSDHSRWASNVRRFAQTSAGLYKGISARYYFSQGSPRYDLIIQPGADPSKALMRYEGATSLRVLANGSLEIGTSLGTVEQRGLLAYQSTVTGNSKVQCQMVADGNTVHFQLGSYDKSKELVIDPLIFSTFMSGAAGSTNNSSLGVAVASDSSGNAVVLGYTGDAQFPTTTGAYKTTFTSYQDIFVSKISANGSTLMYSTFVGGNYNSTTPTAIALDSSGEAFITGYTYSPDYPATAGAYQTKVMSVPSAFVTKVNATGTALSYSTLIGGGGADNPTAIALDSSNNAVIVGYGEENAWPTTTGVIQPTQNQNSSECLIAKVSANGSQLLFASYLGGIASSLGDQATGLALDSSANLYITGNTWSTDFPVTAGSYQPTLTGSDTGFVVKLNSTCTAEIFGTFLGGDHGAQPTGIAVTASGQPVVVGTTQSSDFPLTAGAFQTTPADEQSSFVSALSADGKSLVGSTLLSGSVEDNAWAVAVDKSGNIVVAGQAQSADFPTTSNALQPTSPVATNGFVTKLPINCTTLLYSTYFGGENDDLIQGLSLDPSGNAMVTGWTASPDLPISAGAFQSTNIAYADNNLEATTFVANISLGGSSGTTQSVTLSLAPSTVTGGVLSYGTVTLSPAAPAGGATVAITSGASNLGSLPFTAGASQETFSLTTVPVDATEVIPITVSYNGGSQTQNLTIVPPAPSTLTLGASTATAGTAVTGTITLNGNAGPSGVTVTLSSSNTAAASVPASAPIAAGAKTTTFTVTPKTVSTNTAVTITASFGGVSKTASLTVLAGPTTLSSVTLSPSTVAAGFSTIATANLTGGAPTGGTVVTLKSSNTAAATVPASVTVAATKTSQTFYATALPVPVNTSVAITATVGSVTKTAVLTVTPATVSSIVLNVASITGGTKVGGAAYLSGHAGSSPITIALKSSNTAVGTVPASIVVAANAPGQYLTVTTLPVTAQSIVVITATTGTVSKSATLTVTPCISSLVLNVASVAGGTNVGGAAYLTGHVGTVPVVISLKSSNTAVATVPASITAPTGGLGQYLTVTTAAVTAQTVVTITASTGSVSKTATLTVTPSLSSLQLNVSSVTGGTKVGGAAYLTGHVGTIPVVISLKSSNTAVATVPATITATSGELGQYLTVTTLAVKVKTVVTITATTGSVSRTATLTVLPAG